MERPAHADEQAKLDLPLSLPGLLQRAVALFPEREFLVEGQRRLTFVEVERETSRLARGLMAWGLGKGARIGLMMPNSADWVLNWLAAARMGGLVVCLSSLSQGREIDYLLRHNDIGTLLIPARHLDHDYSGRLEAAMPELARQQGSEIYLESHPYLRRIVVWGECDRPWATQGPGDLLDAAAAVPAMGDGWLARVEAEIHPSDDLLTICTSGSTAYPKAVVHTHGGVLRATRANTPFCGVAPNDRIYNAMPFFWVGGLMRTLLPALFEGATLVFARSPRVADIADVIVKERVTNINATVALCRAVRNEIRRREIDASFIREGFDPPTDPDGKVIPKERRHRPLGMTETFGPHSSEPRNLPAPLGKEGNAGRPIPGIERRIVDPRTGEVLSVGLEGELQVRGPTVMRGYYKRERHEVFTADGYFPTGDSCCIDPDDFVFFKARLDDMIKSGGANVAPREVEVALEGFPEVQEAIVFSVPDDVRGEAVIAAVVPASSETVDSEMLRERLKSQISAYKVPREIFFIDSEEIPRTVSGKPRKTELKASFLAKTDGPGKELR